MATQTGYAPHETLSIHEALRLKALGISKLEMMLPMPADEDLKGFMESELKESKAEFKELRELAERVVRG